MNQTSTATEKKVYYVLTYTTKHSEKRHYITSLGSGGGFFGASTPRHGARFTTLADLLASPANAFTQKYVNGMFVPAVVRVEETPGKDELRIVSKDIIDPRKPVVLFDRERNAAYIRRIPSGVLYGEPLLENATVFADLEEAISAVAESFRLTGRNYPSYQDRKISPHVYQVERVKGEPTITETVLQ